jgi:hypothetical protein
MRTVDLMPHHLRHGIQFQRNPVGLAKVCADVGVVKQGAIGDDRNRDVERP